MLTQKIEEIFYRLYERNSTEIEKNTGPLGFHNKKIGYVFKLNKEGTLTEIIKIEDINRIPPNNEKRSGVSDILYGKYNFVTESEKTGTILKCHEIFFKELCKTNKNLNSFLLFLERVQKNELTTEELKRIKENKPTIKEPNVIFQIERKYLHEDEELLNYWKENYKETWKENYWNSKETQEVQEAQLGRFSNITGELIENRKNTAYITFGRSDKSPGNTIHRQNNTVIAIKNLSRDGIEDEKIYKASLYLKEKGLTLETKKDTYILIPNDLSITEDFIEKSHIWLDYWLKGKDTEYQDSINATLFCRGKHKKRTYEEFRININNSNLQKHLERLFLDKEFNKNTYSFLKSLEKEIFLDINRLINDLLISIHENRPYPEELKNIVIKTIKEKVKKGKKISLEQIAWLKAILIKNEKRDIKMSLDKEEKDFSYLCVRLFATLNKASKEATQRSLSINIIKTKNIVEYLKKYHNIWKQNLLYNYDKKIEDIMSNIDFNNEINNEGMFWMGYHHQNKDELYKKNTDTSKEEKMT